MSQQRFDYARKMKWARDGPRALRAPLRVQGGVGKRVDMGRQLVLILLFGSLTIFIDCGSRGTSCNGPTGGSGTPLLIFTSVPPKGSTDTLQGKEQHVVPSEFYAAVYIHVDGGWIIKPYDSQPDTSINCDGTWTTDITTGGFDAYADAIAAFLVPQSYAAPLLGGSASLPQELYSNSVANVSVNRQAAAQEATLRLRTMAVRTNPNAERLLAGDKSL